MIEVSMLEIVLAVWGGLATAAWIDKKNEARIAQKMFTLLIENKDARDEIIEAHRKWKEAHERQA